MESGGFGGSAGRAGPAEYSLRLAARDLFGPDRCMLGSDLPIERLRSGFEPLYRAYDEMFAGHTQRDREMLLRATAEHWYGTG